MNKIISIIIIVTILLTYNGCQNNEMLNLENEVKDQIDQMSKVNEITKVTIEGMYIEPDSVKDSETIVLDGVFSGEFVEVIVYGEIRNFKHIKIEYDANNNFVEIEELNSFDQLINQTIVIKTYMPEGIPSELIRWESETGKVYEFYIGEYDLSGNQDKILEYIVE